VVEDGIKRKRTKWDVMMEGLDRDIAKAAKQEKREKLTQPPKVGPFNKLVFGLYCL